MKHLSSLLFLGALLAASQAQADNLRGFYAGANLGLVQADDIVRVEPMDGDKRLRLGTAEIFGGYKYNAYLGLDLRVGSGLTGSKQTVSENSKIEYSVGSYYSVYYRPETTNAKASFYGLFGYTNLETETDLLNSDGDMVSTETESSSGFSAGFGAGWFLDNNVNVNMELKALLAQDDNTLPMVTLGFDYRF